MISLFSTRIIYYLFFSQEKKTPIITTYCSKNRNHDNISDLVLVKWVSSFLFSSSLFFFFSSCFFTLPILLHLHTPQIQMPNKWCTGHNQQWFHSSTGSRNQQRCRIWLQSIPASASPTFYNVSFTIDEKREKKNQTIISISIGLFLSTEKVNVGIEYTWDIYFFSFFFFNAFSFIRNSTKSSLLRQIFQNALGLNIRKVGLFSLTMSAKNFLNTLNRVFIYLFGF